MLMERVRSTDALGQWVAKMDLLESWDLLSALLLLKQLPLVAPT